MTDLEKPARRAQRRLWLNRWLATCGWSLAGAAVLFALAVVVQRVFTFTAETAFFGISAVALAGVALVVSVVWTAMTRDSLTEAAARLDVAAGLKERLSSGLYCSQSTDPFAQAVVADARRVSHGISVPHHLPVQPPRSAGYAGGTLLLALLSLWLFPAIDLTGKQEQDQKEKEQADRVERTQAVVKPLVQDTLEQMRKRYPTLKDELEKLEPMEEARLNTPLDVRREAMKTIEKQKEKLENKRSDEELAKVNEFKNMLRRLAAAEKPDSPVGELVKALSNRDFKSAQDALEQLKLELAKAPKTEEEKQRTEELKDQLAKVSAKLKQIAEDEKKTGDDLAKAGLNDQEIKRVLEQLSKKDLSEIAKKLAEKGLSQEQIDRMMAKMKDSSAARAAASELAKNLAQAAQGGSELGQLSASAKAGLSAAADQLSEMESLEQQLNQLNAAMADLNAMKDQLGQGCSMCGGTGIKDGQPCPGCQGSGMGQGQGGKGAGMGNLGQGQGNIAPEQETDFKTITERTKVHTGPGRIIDTQFVDGEQYKGEASDEFVKAAIAAQREATDAVARERIPRRYHSSLKDYFDHAVSDLPTEKVKAAQDKANEEAP